MLDVDGLLEKNPDAREVFEKNRAKLAGMPQAKKRGYQLGLPYGARRPIGEPRESDPKPKARYIR